MSRIYDALKKLEGERLGKAGQNGGGTNGGGNGHGEHEGNGGHGVESPWRRGLRWLRASAGRMGPGGARSSGTLQFGPDVEDQYHRLGTSLLAGPGVEGDQQLRLLGVASSRPGEGATTTAAMFASIVARRRQGRVAIVEANLRAPSFASVFGLSPQPGLAELILGQASLTEAARPSATPNLFVVCGGAPSMPAPALFDSPGLGAVLDQLRGTFEFVVVDLPPVNVYGDASILGPRLDGALLVIEADRTRVPDVERARRTLERAGVRCVGSVLNRRRTYIPGFLEEML